MAKRKTKRYPGSIYVPKGRNQLRVKVKNPNYQPDAPSSKPYLVLASGLPDTPQGWKYAEEMLEQFWLQRKGFLPAPADDKKAGRLTFRQLWDKYEKIRGQNILPQSLKVFKRGFNTIITSPDLVFNRTNFYAFVHAFVSDHKVAKSTFNIYLRGVKQVVNWAYRNNLIDAKIDVSEYYFAEDSKENKFFTKDECLNLFVYFWNNRRKSKRVDDREFALLLELLWSTGARIADVLTLTWEQIDFENGIITWKNKMTKKPEPVPVSSKVIQALTFLQSFTPAREKVFKWKVRAYETLRTWLNTAMRDLGIDADGRCFHSFRKTFCNRVFDLSLPIHLSLVLVRHKTVDITIRNYLAKDYSRLKLAVNSL